MKQSKNNEKSKKKWKNVHLVQEYMFPILENNMIGKSLIDLEKLFIQRNKHLQPGKIW